LRIDGNPVLYQATGKLCALVVAGERMEKLDGQGNLSNTYIYIFFKTKNKNRIKNFAKARRDEYTHVCAVITQEIRERVHSYPIILASAVREGYIFGESTFNIPGTHQIFPIYHHHHFKRAFYALSFRVVL
jgi:hypothetical protein